MHKYLHTLVIGMSILLTFTSLKADYFRDTLDLNNSEVSKYIVHEKRLNSYIDDFKDLPQIKRQNLRVFLVNCFVQQFLINNLMGKKDVAIVADNVMQFVRVNSSKYSGLMVEIDGKYRYVDCRQCAKQFLAVLDCDNKPWGGGSYWSRLVSKIKGIWN